MFLFVNPISGAQEGKHFIEIKKEYFNFNYDPFSDPKRRSFSTVRVGNDYKEDNNSNLHHIYIYNITNKDSFTKGIEVLRKLTDLKNNAKDGNEIVNNNDLVIDKEVNPNLGKFSKSASHIKLLIGGGDGTVLSIIETLILQYKLNLKNCVFGMIPLGTGNDLSNAMGFGPSIDIESSIESVTDLLKNYIDSEETKIDIWKVKLKLDDEEGCIIQHKNAKKDIKKDDNGVAIKEFTKTFINYFSLGYDARVGFGFEGSRSSSRFFNKLIYFWEGLKKSCCRRTITVRGFIKAFKTIESKNKKKKLENYYDKYNLKNEHVLESNDKDKNHIANEVQIKETKNDVNKDLLKKSSDNCKDNEENVQMNSIHKEFNNSHNNVHHQTDTDITVNQVSFLDMNKKTFGKKFKSNDIFVVSESEIEETNKAKIKDDKKNDKNNADSNVIKEENEDEQDKPLVETVLKGDPVSLICQNINYYMGGTSDIWKKSGKNFGVEIVKSDGVNNIVKDKSKSSKEHSNEEVFQRERRRTIEKIGIEKSQSFNDRQLEFFSYSSGITLGMEKIFTGLADKIYHGPGPIMIEFKNTPKLNENDKKNRVYMNLDGEYFHIVKPVYLKIVNNKEIFGGQIPFLCKLQEKK